MHLILLSPAQWDSFLTIWKIPAYRYASSHALLLQQFRRSAIALITFKVTNGSQERRTIDVCINMSCFFWSQRAPPSISSKETAHSYYKVKWTSKAPKIT
jgi:hypothetical protein